MSKAILANSALVESAGISRPPLLPSRWSMPWLACLPLRAYNALRRLWPVSVDSDTAFPALNEIRRFAAAPTDINEHLELMFIDALLFRPKLIVELGVRSGASTFVFERVGRTCGSLVVSADLDDCSTRSQSPTWYFHQGDDVEFAAAFPDFCNKRAIDPAIDLLFVDTSHYYDHTVQEIQAWFPLMAPRAKAIFHDTNSRVIGLRKDGCFELAWDNDRGVIRAIEDYLEVEINESKRTECYSKGWLLRHWPNCNGLTILDRLC